MDASAPRRPYRSIGFTTACRMKPNSPGRRPAARLYILLCHLACSSALRYSNTIRFHSCCRLPILPKIGCHVNVTWKIGKRGHISNLRANRPTYHLVKECKNRSIVEIIGFHSWWNNYKIIKNIKRKKLTQAKHIAVSASMSSGLNNI